MTEILTIVAHIQAKPGMEVRMKQDLLSLIIPTRAEAGCITFDLLADVKDPTKFVLYENWESQAALDAHFRQPYVKQVLQAYEVTLAQPIAAVSLHKLEPLANASIY